jgi:hypothetical protein
MTNDLTGWSQPAEMQFIDRLAESTNPEIALQGYIDGMRKRVNFGKIDAKTCIQYAQFLLTKAKKPTRAEEFDLAQ